MRHKGHRVNKPLLWHSVSGTGLYALVPPIVIGLLLPAGLLLTRTVESPALTIGYIDFSAALLIPACAVWWPAFVFKERIEGEGRELFYFLSRKGEMATALALALLYWVLLVPFVLVARGAPGFSMATVALLLVRCLFMTSLVFSAAFMLQSSALAHILALLFNMTAMTPLEALVEALAPVSIYSIGQEPMLIILLYVVLTIALLMLGEVRSRHFTT